MRTLLVTIATFAALHGATADAAPCPASGAMTTAERTLEAIFDAIDDAGRLLYDAAMPGDEISFQRGRDGRWHARVPRAAAARARANECDLAAKLDEAAAFYGPSIDFSEVRVLVGDPLMDSSFVFHDRVKIGKKGDPCPSTRTLVHEFAHVWQHQHGQWQASLGLVDQVRNHWIDAYALEPRRVIRAARDGRSIDFFIRERQAELFATAWEIETGRAGPLDPEYVAAVKTLVGPALRKPPTWR